MLGHLGITWITMMRSLLFTQNDEQITKSYRIASFHKTFPTFKIQFKIWSQKIPEWFSGWWLTYPSEKYLFVNGKDYPWLSPICYGNIKNVETTNQVYSWIINGLIYIYIHIMEFHHGWSLSQVSSQASAPHPAPHPAVSKPPLAPRGPSPNRGCLGTAENQKNPWLFMEHFLGLEILSHHFLRLEILFPVWE